MIFGRKQQQDPGQSTFSLEVNHTILSQLLAGDLSPERHGVAIRTAKVFTAFTLPTPGVSKGLTPLAAPLPLIQGEEDQLDDLLPGRKLRGRETLEVHVFEIDVRYPNVVSWSDLESRLEGFEPLPPYYLAILWKMRPDLVRGFDGLCTFWEPCTIPWRDEEGELQGVGVVKTAAVYAAVETREGWVPPMLDIRFEDQREVLKTRALVAVVKKTS